MLRRRFSRGKKELVRLFKEAAVQAFAESHETWCSERALLLKRLKSQKELIVRVFGDGGNQLAVGEIHTLLDDEGTQSHSEWLGRASFLAREHTGILLF